MSFLVYISHLSYHQRFVYNHWRVKMPTLERRCNSESHRGKFTVKIVVWSFWFVYPIQHSRYQPEILKLTYLIWLVHSKTVWLATFSFTIISSTSLACTSIVIIASRVFLNKKVVEFRRINGLETENTKSKINLALKYS